VKIHFSARSNLVQVFRHEILHGVVKNLALEYVRIPKVPERGFHDWALFFGQRTVIQIGGIAGESGISGAVGFDKLQAAGYDASAAAALHGRILYRMLQVEQRSRLLSNVVVVDENRALLEQVPVALSEQVNGRVEQRVARTHEGGQRFAGSADERLVEGDPFIARRYRIADADDSVPVSDGAWNTGYLVAIGLALIDRAAKLPESLEEK
jgi:hypothetical protein